MTPLESAPVVYLVLVPLFSVATTVTIAHDDPRAKALPTSIFTAVLFALWPILIPLGLIVALNVVAFEWYRRHH